MADKLPPVFCSSVQNLQQKRGEGLSLQVDFVAAELLPLWAATKLSKAVAEKVYVCGSKSVTGCTC